jgi:hypothetical protein
MALIQCSVDDKTMERLKRCAKELGRSIEDLAESAIAEAALDAMRAFDATEHDTSLTLWGKP